MGRPISPSRMAWLREQLELWRDEGLVDAQTYERIAATYTASTRPRAVQLFRTLGATLLGIGLTWLVAANVEVDEVSPLMRFAGVAVLWLVLVAVVECVSRWRPALALLAALAYAAVVFQAAQSLQVPAYEPSLLLAVALGVIAYAYAVGERFALVVGIGTLVGWYGWALEGESAVVGLAVAVPACAGVAQLYEPLGAPWRIAAALLALGALFVVAVPEAVDGTEMTTLAWAGVAVGCAICAAATARGATRRGELAGALGVLAAVLLLVAIAPSDTVSLWDEDPTGAQVAYTLLACACFLAAAIGVALAGVAREQPGLTNLAFGALMLFVVVQSFGLLATILSGAALLLVCGALLLGIGVLLDRGRRRLIEEIEE